MLNNVSVSTKFKNSGIGVVVEGVDAILGISASENIPVNQNGPLLESVPGLKQWLIDENNHLRINLVKGESECNPMQSLQSERKAFHFYIKLDSSLGYEFNIAVDERGWTISKKTSCIFSRKPVFVPMLSKRWNIWPVRLILWPFELAWKLVVSPVALIRALYKMSVAVLAQLEEPPDRTNVTVGSEEE